MLAFRYGHPTITEIDVFAEYRGDSSAQALSYEGGEVTLRGTNFGSGALLDKNMRTFAVYISRPPGTEAEASLYDEADYEEFDQTDITASCDREGDLAIVCSIPRMWVGHGSRVYAVHVDVASGNDDNVLTSQWFQGLQDLLPKVCPLGHWQESAQVCVQCNPGHYRGAGDDPEECELCAPGFMASDPGAVTCVKCGAGTFSDGEGAAECEACGAGQYRTTEQDSTTCQLCEPGLVASDPGGVACTECDAGRMSDTDGAEECTFCADVGEMYYQPDKAQTECLQCEDDTVPSEGQVSCARPPWTVASDCKPDLQFLDDHSDDNKDWACVDCPHGAHCRGVPTYDQVTASPGFRAVSWDTHVFGKCLAPEACPGLTAAGEHGECTEGHDNSSELCSTCVEGWSRLSKVDVCQKCPPPVDQGAILALVPLVVLLVFSFLVFDMLDGAKDMIPPLKPHVITRRETARALRKQRKTTAVVPAAPSPSPSPSPLFDDDGSSCHQTTKHPSHLPFHSVAIRIVSSYLQVAGLLAGFDLTLPQAVKDLVRVESAASSVGPQLLNFDCSMAERNDFHVFLLKQLVAVWVLPLTGLVLCALTWTVLRLVWNGGRCRPTSLTAKDGFVGSLSVLFYTLFPSLVGQLSKAFSCTHIGEGDDVDYLLTEALSVRCLSPQHWDLLLLVGLPGVTIYMIGVPTCVSCTLVRKRKRGQLFTHQKKFSPSATYRYGFWFAGYRPGWEMWEAVVMARKAGFTMASIFLRAYGTSAQVVAATMILIVAAALHAHALPYMSRHHNRLESISLHGCLAQLTVALLCNLVGKVPGADGVTDTLGSRSTIICVSVCFSTTLLFLAFVLHHTVVNSVDHPGAIGKASRSVVRRLSRAAPPPPRATTGGGRGVRERAEVDDAGEGKGETQEGRVGSTLPPVNEARQAMLAELMRQDRTVDEEPQ